MTDTIERRRAFEGVHNFRDFGGYRAGGRALRAGRFFRSANHAEATEKDLAEMAALGITTIVDLRRPQERQMQPSRRWQGFSAEVIENGDHDEGAETWHGFMAEWDFTAEHFMGFQRRYYTRAPHLPRLVDLFARYFDALAQDKGPIVVHCAAGKDRTGLVVALTHMLAGVHRDDIVADYLLTNDPNRFALFGPRWAKMIEEQRGKAPTQEVMEVAMGVHPELLDISLKEIETRSGGVEAYLRDELKVDARKRARIEQALFG